jgi:hypothetical protein
MLQFWFNLRLLRGLELHILTVAKKRDDHEAIAHLNEAEQKVKAAGFNPVRQLIQGEPEQVIATMLKKKTSACC